jgi:hypothetical protein
MNCPKGAIRSAALLLAAACAACCGAGALGAEKKPPVKKPPAKKPAVVRPRKVQKPSTHQLAQLERQAARFSTAGVVKVIEAGEIKEEKDRPEIEGDNRHSWVTRQYGQRAQRVRCQVLEMLRGPKDTKEIVVLVRHFDYHGVQRLLRDKHPKRRNPKAEEVIKGSSLGVGEKCLMLLAVDENLAPLAGGKGKAYSTVCNPLYGPPAEAVKRVREISARIRKYQNPPAAGQAQLAATARYLKKLESGDYGVRAKAHEALVKIGPPIMKLLEKNARENKDLEVRLRCRKILDDVKPLPGGHSDDWAGNYVIKKVEPKEAGEEKDGKKLEVEALPVVK